MWIKNKFLSGDQVAQDYSTIGIGIVENWNGVSDLVVDHHHMIWNNKKAIFMFYKLKIYDDILLMNCVKASFWGFFGLIFRNYIIFWELKF